MIHFFFVLMIANLKLDLVELETKEIEDDGKYTPSLLYNLPFFLLVIIEVRVFCFLPTTPSAVMLA